MAEQGLLGITIPEADGGQGGTLMDAVIAIETVASVCPRSADVVQAGNFGADPRARRVRHAAAEGALPQAPARRRRRDLRRHDRARGGLGGDRSHDDRDARRRRATAINGARSSRTHAPYADVILAYVRFGPGVGGIGSVLIDTKRRGVRFGQALDASCRARNGRRSISTTCYVPPEKVVLQGRRLQEADRRLQRRAHRQHRALARARALLPTSSARAVGDAAQAVRAPAVRVPGPAVEVRRHEDEARRRASCCSIARRRTPTAAFRRPRRRRSPRRSATRPASTSRTRRCR